MAAYYILQPLFYITITLINVVSRDNIKLIFMSCIFSLQFSEMNKCA